MGLHLLTLPLTQPFTTGLPHCLPLRTLPRLSLRIGFIASILSVFLPGCIHCTYLVGISSCRRRSCTKDCERCSASISLPCRSSFAAAGRAFCSLSAQILVKSRSQASLVANIGFEVLNPWSYDLPIDGPYNKRQQTGQVHTRVCRSSSSRAKA